MLNYIRTHLSWKVFLSYLLVIIVGAIVLITTTNLSVPSAFERHMAWMSEVIDDNMVDNNAQIMEMELFTNYQAAVIEALSIATAAALAAAMLASIFISKQVVAPIQRMREISTRIADGEYQERLKISGNLHTDQLDELNQLALTFNQMTDKLENTETIRVQLMGDITHELRTPLTAIKGYMEGMRDGMIPPTPDNFQQVSKEVDRLQRLVNDLQELSRIESGAYQLNIQLVDPETLVKAAVSNLLPKFKEKDICIEIRINDGVPKIAVDSDRVLQVLINLLGNALQYSSQGGRVSVSVIVTKSEVQFSITDSGIGISRDHLSLIFHRFYRADKSRTRASGGSGIGLTIAQALVKAHNGRIWARSPGEGKGSTFVFALPIA